MKHTLSNSVHLKKRRRLCNKKTKVNFFSLHAEQKTRISHLMVILISLDSRRRYVSLSFIFDIENKIKNQTLNQPLYSRPTRAHYSFPLAAGDGAIYLPWTIFVHLSHHLAAGEAHGARQGYQTARTHARS